MEHDHPGHATTIRPLESPREYAKFVAVIIGITGLSVLLTSWRAWTLRQFLNDFMAVFFITFATFKFINLEMFAVTYRGYDIIAKRFRLWGYLFPLVEIVLGFAYLLTNKNTSLNVVTLLITGVAAVGVLQELTKKSNIVCACLGTVIRLPLSKISFVEDFLMFAMAAAMLIIK
jgi:hypothetical protein